MTVKKTVTKVAVKKVAGKKATPSMDDNIYWVVMERRFFSSKAVELYRTRFEAEGAAAHLKLYSPTAFNRYSVQRVELTK